MTIKIKCRKLGKARDKAIRRKAYCELLKHPLWQRKRLEIFQRDSWRCCRCLEKNITLHVHHKYYVRELLPWEHGDDCYQTLCENCHNQQHSIRRFYKGVKPHSS